MYDGQKVDAPAIHSEGGMVGAFCEIKIYGE
jgi:hypothetical protein